jgi:hypothetical protein
MELLVDLPSLITRLRERVIPDNNGPQELPGLEPAPVDHLDGVGVGLWQVPLKLGPPQQETKRHRADLPDPEQAQRQVIERQEEDLLFDVSVLEESTDHVVEVDARRPTLKVPGLRPPERWIWSL